MSSLWIETLTMPAAGLGPENPLPMLTPRLSATASLEVDGSIPAEDCKYFGYGLDAGWLPHRGQDDYDRVRSNREFVALVLENDFLKATILPEVGGRLWSLVHKPSQRNLLFVNPVFQPANLAVRGAWITGGIEWNACVYGHSPFTCSPLFAAVVEDAQFGDVLRLYEWDRTRCVPFQIDFMLPEGSRYLFARMRLVNPHAETIPMYWWSNMTVPESPDTRVIAPTQRAYTYEYWGPPKAVSVPQHGETDISYSMNIPYGADYFFRIPDGARPWIAALDGDGRGLVQTSTSRQVGRKLFAWGAKQGGRRWQEFLSTPGSAYLEIQAGLARSQLECLPMPAGAQWEWIEAYGLMEADPAKVHGSSWADALDDVEARLERSIPQDVLEARLRETADLAVRPPKHILHRGSGWGALERRRRERFNEPPFCSPGLVFDDAGLGDDQVPWLSLLEDGILPEREPDHEPGAWMVQQEWRELVEASTQNAAGDHWLAHLHLGLMHYADGNIAAAENAWHQSLRRRRSGWAYRNLAVLRHVKGRDIEALSFFERAHGLLPELRPLIVEYCECLLAANRPADALELLESLPKDIRHHSRVRLMEARAALELGLPDRCSLILSQGYELVDIREGESSLTKLWFDLQAQVGANGNGESIRADLKVDRSHHAALPRALDFRVMPDPEPVGTRQPHLDGQGHKATHVRDRSNTRR